MQVTADLFDWDWVKSAKNIEYFFTILLESDDANSKIVSCYDLMNWTDSHVLYTEAWEMLEWLEQHTDEHIAELIRKGIYPLVSENSFIDELNLSDASEGHYYASLSPETVRETADAFNLLDIPALCSIIKENYDMSLISAFDDISEFESYLNQWLFLLNRAKEKGMGIIGHMG